MLNAIYAIKIKAGTGGKRGRHTCDHGLPRRSLRVRPLLRVELESKSDDLNIKLKRIRPKSDHEHTESASRYPNPWPM